MAKSLLNSAFSLSEHKRQIYIAAPPAGTQLQEIMESVFWAHVSRHANVGDRIDCLPVDSSWYAELLVIAKPATPGLRVALLSHVDLAEISEHLIEFAGHVIRYEGPLQLWSVTRKARGNKPELRLKDRLATSEEARDYVKGQSQAGLAA